MPEHANTYLALFPLPAFDAPWPEAPAFYRTLAGWRARGEPRPTLVEAPALTSRTRHLYRSYALVHGARTLLAPLAGEFPFLPEGPSVALLEPGRLETSGADYLVAHRDVASELAPYWAFVYGAGSAGTPRDAAAYMARHAQYPGPLPVPPPFALALLERRFGPPVYSDETLVVYGLRGAPAPDQDSAPSTSRSS